MLVQQESLLARALREEIIKLHTFHQDGCLLLQKDPSDLLVTSLSCVISQTHGIHTSWCMRSDLVMCNYFDMKGLA